MPARRLTASAALVALVVAVTACRGGGDTGLVLDGRPFDPDVSGVLERASLHEIVLDGEVHALGDELVVFSAATLERVSLAGRTGSYVQVGLDGDTVEWIAMVGDVLPGRDVVLFEDDVAAIEDGVVRFVSGYRVAIADGVEVPAADALLVFIDPASDEVVEAERR